MSDKRVGKLSFVYDEELKDYVMSLEWGLDIGSIIFSDGNEDLHDEISSNLDKLTEIVQEAYKRAGLDISNIF